MIVRKMAKIINLFNCILIIIIITSSNLKSEEFNSWLNEFKATAISKGISKKTVNDVMADAKFLEKVIYYDNKQPEFFEKTNVYISKRASRKAAKIAKIKFIQNKKIFLKVEKEFNVEKELLLALWSIETNFGKYFGKMDIVSSLATLSFDKRRSEFFTRELITLLRLVDNKILSKEMLFGSWAGALGNFQFMPSTILNYGIDYDNDGNIDLKNSMSDSIASAANYMNKIGWKYDGACFTQVSFNKNVNKKLFNHSARNMKNRKPDKFWNNLSIVDLKQKKISLKEKSSLVLPDGDINSPKYLTTENYEKILKWNRSLRFALSVCTLKNMIKNEI
tara:strand:- start:722 stop:1726 length:1005 start_codon:yes stop_codon:yes gene_type:complete